MSAAKQWLVDPKHPDTAMYITNKPDVAQKRADAGDYVVALERSGAANFDNPDFRPYYKRLMPTNHEDDEL